ncbi:MAG: hypothetical protein JWN76_2091 [Chitinophagaceae bacterium]|nr:hypothetical protein [Chitinophagaceae bacterium]
MTDHTVSLNGISYGGNGLIINEDWKFFILNDEIKFQITRSVSKPALVEEVFLPVFNFNHINTWEGAYQSYGGLAWFYLFNEKLATCGVHSNSSRFWNSKTGNGMNVSVDAPGKEEAMKYSRTDDDKLAYSVSLSEKEMLHRLDSGTNRRRFVPKRTDVWAAFNMPAGKTVQTLTLNIMECVKHFCLTTPAR